MNIYGAYILGDLEVSGSIIGTASLAISSSYATTASFALNVGSTINTSSFVTTSSFNSFTASYNTGSFTGSFTGSLLGTASFATTASYALNAGGAGVTNWSESFSSATQASSQWTPLNAASTVNAVITPKGSGSILAQIPDGTTTGGNARGIYTVDLQRVRSSANQIASGSYDSILGGFNNRVLGVASVIVGGRDNTALWNNAGGYDVIVGGQSNQIQASNGWSFIGGGTLNTIVSFVQDNVIVGGRSNTIEGSWTVIGGGRSNSTVGTSLHYKTIGGGYLNSIANSEAGTIAGGYNNTITGSYNFIGGGYTNLISGAYAMVVGGLLNTASADYAFASGRRARSIHNGAFVWADSTNADYSSAGNNTFNVRATGGSFFTGSMVVTGSTSIFGNLSLTSASSFIDITPQTGSTMGYKIGSSWVARFDASRNNFIFGSNGTTYPSITTGFNNFFAGNNAIALGLTSGNNNIAIGFDNSNSEPLRNLTTGFNNIALGRASLSSNSVGEANIGIGVFSLGSNQSGSNNIAIGYNSLLSYTRYGTIGIGYDAFGNFVGTGLEDDNSIAIGYTAGRNVTNGRHVLIGYVAGRDMSGATSDYATVVGYAAGYGLRTSTNDTAIGGNAMSWFNSLGSTTSNVAIGYGAMQLASSSRYMVAVGYEAGYQNGTATGLGSNDGSVYIGYTAGRATLGNYNVFIGYGAGSTITAASNTFILANSSTALLMTGSFTTKRVDFFGSVNAPSFTGSIQATGSLNFNGSELSTAWTSYTPAWTAATSDPVLNNGTITGAYKVIGKTCFVRGRLIMGSTTTYGTGAWYFQLPFTASTPYGIQIPASFLDNGTNWYSGLMNGGRLGSSTKSEIQWQNTSSVAVGLESTVPFTWGNLDEISWNGSYEIT